jgi:dTDP-4-amino-4,6-dideoxygalactose transaminase
VINVVSNIPPLDLKRQYQAIGADVSAAVLEVLASGAYIGGPNVQNFEQQFATYVGTQACVGCNSGTDALYLALRAMKIGAGDEVITTPFTFIATAEMISAVGAKPVFVDIDLTTFNLDLDRLAAAITPRTKAIMPVHLFGNPVDMTELMSIAKQHNLIVIEDCAQATGAKWNGQQVGSIGHFGCFSFFPTKNLGACGDGGAITLNDSALADDLRIASMVAVSDIIMKRSVSIVGSMPFKQQYCKSNSSISTIGISSGLRSRLVTRSYLPIFLILLRHKLLLGVNLPGISTQLGSLHLREWTQPLIAIKSARVSNRRV